MPRIEVEFATRVPIASGISSQSPAGRERELVALVGTASRWLDTFAQNQSIEAVLEGPTESMHMGFPWLLQITTRLVNEMGEVSE